MSPADDPVRGLRHPVGGLLQHGLSGSDPPACGGTKGAPEVGPGRRIQEQKIPRQALICNKKRIEDVYTLFLSKAPKALTNEQSRKKSLPFPGVCLEHRFQTVPGQL